ncbi:hypothetical protein ABH925_007513 [Streptacidiphilus sp. EB129]
MDAGPGGRRLGCRAPLHRRAGRAVGRAPAVPAAPGGVTAGRALGSRGSRLRLGGVHDCIPMKSPEAKAAAVTRHRDPCRGGPAHVRHRVQRPARGPVTPPVTRGSGAGSRPWTGRRAGGGRPATGPRPCGVDSARPAVRLSDQRDGVLPAGRGRRWQDPLLPLCSAWTSNRSRFVTGPPSDRPGRPPHCGAGFLGCRPRPRRYSTAPTVRSQRAAAEPGLPTRAHWPGHGRPAPSTCRWAGARPLAQEIRRRGTRRSARPLRSRSP